MARPWRTADEGTARFIFQAATGLGLFTTLAALILGARGSMLGAWIFLVLALASLATLAYFGRRYRALRRLRWGRELERSSAALEQLFTRAAGEPPGGAPPPPPDGDHA